MLGGDTLLYMFLVSLLIDVYLLCYSLIYVFILCCVKSRIYFVYLCFPHIPTFHLNLPLFVTHWQRQLKQRVDRKHTQQKARENSPYDEQQLLLRTNKKVKKNSSPPIKIGKTKQVLGKTILGKNKGGGEK